MPSFSAAIPNYTAKAVAEVSSMVRLTGVRFEIARFPSFVLFKRQHYHAKLCNMTPHTGRDHPFWKNNETELKSQSHLYIYTDPHIPLLFFD
jgi:hypothetical protein